MIPFVVSTVEARDLGIEVKDDREVRELRRSAKSDINDERVDVRAWRGGGGGDMEPGGGGGKRVGFKVLDVDERNGKASNGGGGVLLRTGDSLSAAV